MKPETEHTVQSGSKMLKICQARPTVLTSKTIPQAQAKARATFTGIVHGFRLTSQSANRQLFSKKLPANVNDDNILKDRTKGVPVAEVELTFTTENGKTRITGAFPSGPAANVCRTNRAGHMKATDHRNKTKTALAIGGITIRHKRESKKIQTFWEML